MKGISPLPFENRPTVLLFAKAGGLTSALVEIFLGNFCRVKIVSDKKDKWLSSLAHIIKNKTVEVLDEEDLPTVNLADYIIYVSPCVEENVQDDKLFHLAEKTAEKFSVKTLLVFASNIDLRCQKKTLLLAKKLTKENPEIFGIVYLGQPIGPRVHLSDKRFVTRMIKDAVLGRPVNLPKDKTDLHPVFVSTVAREIVRMHFSFGGPGDEVLLSTPSLDSEKLYAVLKRYVSQIEKKYVSEKWDYQLPKSVIKKRVDYDVGDAFKQTLEWFTSHPPEGFEEEELEEKRKAKPKKKKRKKKVRKKKIRTKISLPKIYIPKPKLPSYSFSFLKISLFIFAALFIILSPYLFLTAGGLGFKRAADKAKEGSFSSFNKWLTFSKITFSLARAELSFFSKIPLAGKIFHEGFEFSDLALEGVSVGRRIYNLSTLGNKLVDNILGDESYNVISYSEQFTIELDSIYKDLSFLEGELYSNGQGSTGLLSGFIEKSEFKKVRQQIMLARQISKELPWLLGSEEKRQYLVLFQNNMELRPTGGFIGSFAIVTFEGGMLADISVQDVYSADGQLKGHVEPPDPIKKYLGEANWFLRDSNWDPDFPTSAERAEWFLDKEINVSVDGVVSIDLELAKDIVGAIGPIYIEDFGKEMTSENLYEVTQYEVEKDFFPGSRKKANFLTALVREILLQTTSMKKEDYIKMAKVVYENLTEKHIQLFFHNKDVQRSLSEFAWDGAVYHPVCTNNCYADYTGIVEANVGVNKANYFVKREASLTTELREGLIKRTFLITLKNEAEESLGPSGRYKTYMRVFSPSDADFLPTEILFGNSRELKDPETLLVRGREEAGVYLELSPGQTKTVVFRWESSIDINFAKEGEYRLVWRKQAGTKSDPVSFKIILPEGIKPLVEPELSLTGQGTYRYNTNLTRDFSSRIFW